MAKDADEIKLLRDDLDTTAAISAVFDSEGGQILVKGLVADIVNAVDTISTKYDKLTMQEFVALGSDMKNKLDLVRAISRAPKNKKYLEETLAEALKE